MKTFIGILFLCSVLLNASGQGLPADPISIRSSSGQFVVFGASKAGPLPRALTEATNLVRLEPAFLPVSCERIRQALWTRLGARAAWRGKVHLVLHPAQGLEEPIVINSSYFTDGWTYRVDLPDAIEPARLVDALVRVLLLEMANRTAGARSAELPFWLSEGLSAELLRVSEIDLVVEPPRQTINNVSISQKLRSARKIESLTLAHAELSSRPPLTLAQLSWPTPDQMSVRRGEIYRSSAQLFVHELLELRNGPDCVRNMVEQLPHDYNWQTTFLRAFRQHFQRQLDVEKWWALQLVHFTGRELSQTWPEEDSLKKLDEIVRSAVQVRVRTNELPMHAVVSLQTIIQEWDFPRQSQALREKVVELALLRLRIAPDLATLAEDYGLALDTYLQQLSKSRPVPDIRKPLRGDFARRVQETLMQLDFLDTKREALHQGNRTFTAATTRTESPHSPPK